MPAVSELLTAVSVLALAVAPLIRYAPNAIVTLLAGLVAVFSRDRERGHRAMTVLQILRTRPPETRSPGHFPTQRDENH